MPLTFVRRKLGINSKKCNFEEYVIKHTRILSPPGFTKADFRNAEVKMS